VKSRVNGGVYVVAGLALIPPPFPFTPFVLASGALGMNAWGFFTGLAAARILRFGVEGTLAYLYGSQILRWMKTPIFQTVVGVIIVLAVIGTIVSAIVAIRGSRTRSGSGERPPRPRRIRAATDPR